MESKIKAKRKTQNIVDDEPIVEMNFSDFVKEFVNLYPLEGEERLYDPKDMKLKFSSDTIIVPVKISKELWQEILKYYNKYGFASPTAFVEAFSIMAIRQILNEEEWRDHTKNVGDEEDL